MADRTVESALNEVPDIDDSLDSLLLMALARGRERMASGDELPPFTLLGVKGHTICEEHPGEEPQECYDSARRTVQNARGAQGYVLCYDGYVDTDIGQKDAIIAEGGQPGEETGFALALLYTRPSEDAAPVFEAEPAYVGPAPNFMMALVDLDEAEDDAEEEDFELEETEIGELDPVDPEDA